MCNQLEGRVERAQKPVKCPRCGARPLATILYGEPEFSENLEQMIGAGRFVLGGCCLTLDAPSWQCTHCGLQIYPCKRDEM